MRDAGGDLAQRPDPFRLAQPRLRRGPGFRLGSRGGQRRRLPPGGPLRERGQGQQQDGGEGRQQGDGQQPPQPGRAGRIGAKAIDDEGRIGTDAPVGEEPVLPVQGGGQPHHPAPARLAMPGPGQRGVRPRPAAGALRRGGQAGEDGPVLPHQSQHVVLSLPESGEEVGEMGWREGGGDGAAIGAAIRAGPAAAEGEAEPAMRPGGQHPAQERAGLPGAVPLDVVAV